MTRSGVDSLVDDYLAHLHAASRALPPDRAWELVEGIREHISAARTEGAAGDEAEVRAMLARLGTPEEIVAAAQEAAGTPGASSPFRPPAPRLEQPGTGREAAAVTCLTAGSLVPLVGWVVGVVLLWTSGRWRTWEKMLGTFVVPGGPGLVMLLGLTMPARVCTGTTSGSVMVVGGPGGTQTTELPTTSVTSCSGGFPLSGRAELAVLVALLVAPFVVGVFLYTRARRRALFEPPVAVAPRPARWGALEVVGLLLLGLGTFFLPLLGPAVGLVLVCISEGWSRAEKTTAVTIAVAPMALMLLMVVVFASGALLAFGLLAVLFFLLAAAGPSVSALHLFLLLDRRRG